MTVSKNVGPMNLSYPNVSFRETIAGPLPVEMGFRNTIGVAAVFNRGPEGPILVRNRSEAFHLFGEDDSPGSVFLKQAMYCGATKFYVSRVVPTARRSSTVIPLQARHNPETNEAYIANSTRRRTVGFTFEADYVSPIITKIGGFSTEPVEIDNSSHVAIDLEGNAVLHFEVRDLLQGAGAQTSSGACAGLVGLYLKEVTSQSQLQTVSFAYGDEAFVRQYMKPGRILELVASNTATVQQRAYDQGNNIVTDCINQSEGFIYLANTPAFNSGQLVRVSSSGTLPGGLSAKRYYWARVHANNVVTLHTSRNGAIGQVVALDKVVFSSLGTGNLTLTPNQLLVTQQATGSGVTADAIDTATDEIILGTSNVDALDWPLVTGDKVRVSSSGTLPTGLAAGTDYYVRVNGSKVTLHTTAADARNNTGRVDITAVGTGTLTILVQDPTFSLNAQNGLLEIMSYPFFEDGLPSVLVKGLVTPQSTSCRVKVVDPTRVNSLPYYNLVISFKPMESVVPSDIHPIMDMEGKEEVGVLQLGIRHRDWVNIDIYSPVPNEPRLRTVKFSGVKLRFGKPTEVGDLDFVLRDSFAVGLTKGKVTIGQFVDDSPSNDQRFDPNLISSINAFQPGLPVAEVLDMLASAIQGSPSLSSIIGEVYVQTSRPPYTITLTSNFAGLASNRLRFRLKRHWVNVDGNATTPNPPEDVLVGAYTPATPEGVLNNTYSRFVGGSDPMHYASRVLYDNAGRPLVLIKALSPGRQGNNIRFSIRPGTRGQWRIEVHDDTPSVDGSKIPPEAYNLNNFSVDPQTGEFLELLESRMIRAFFIPLVESEGLPIRDDVYALVPNRLAPPVEGVTDQRDPKHISHRGLNFLKNIYLQGGKDPAGYARDNVDERDYVAAVRRLEEVDVAILSIAGVHVQDARYEEAITEAISQAENSSTSNGLRIAVLQAPPAMTVSRAALVANMVARSERVVVVSGYITMAGYNHLGVNRVPSNGYYCGLLAMTQPHYSPAAVSVTPPLLGVISCDTRNSPDLLDYLTRNGIEALHYDPGLRQFKFLNGVNAALDPRLRYVCVRRMADQMITDLTAALQWVRSMPHTPDLRRLVASAVDAYLRQALRDQKIYAFRPTICDESNNTPLDMSRGIMNISINYTPVFPADFIRVDMVRDIVSTFSVVTSASAL